MPVYPISARGMILRYESKSINHKAVYHLFNEPNRVVRKLPGPGGLQEWISIGFPYVLGGFGRVLEGFWGVESPGPPLGPPCYGYN